MTDFEGIRREEPEVNQDLLAELGDEEFFARQHWINNPYISPVDKLHLFKTAILNARAVAWDEGFESGEKDVFEHDAKNNWDEHGKCIENPYRQENQSEG